MVGGTKFTVLGYKVSVFEDRETHKKTSQNNVYISVKLDDYNKDVIGCEVGVAYVSDDIYDYITKFEPNTEFTGVVTRKKGTSMQIGCVFDD